LTQPNMLVQALFKSFRMSLL